MCRHDMQDKRSSQTLAVAYMTRAVSAHKIKDLPRAASEPEASSSEKSFAITSQVTGNSLSLLSSTPCDIKQRKQGRLLGLDKGRRVRHGA